MIKNYFKLALKVLSRKKFFTFISLFGISFTLMILMVTTAFLDHEFGSHAPLSERDKMVFLDYATLEFHRPDTTYTIDSAMVAGTMKYDTTDTKIEEERTSMSRTEPAYSLINNHLREVQGVKDMSLFVPGAEYTIFKNSNKLLLAGIFTDERYWNIFDFSFTEGQPYTQQDVKNSTQVVIMTEKAAREYYGTQSSYLGKEIEIEKKNYKVIGIIETPNTMQDMVYADIYMPYTNLPAHSIGEPVDIHGSFKAVFIANTAAAKDQIITDLNRIASQYKLPKPEEYNRLILNAHTFTERYADDILDNETAQESETQAKWILAFLLGLFILLPTLNLININISRILERAAEIGVRKSFGAHSQTILMQFVFENVILTFIGGMLGFIMALGFLYFINSSGILENVHLGFNPKVFLYSLLICLFFGILSGVIPAYRMSKIQIVDSLRGSNS